MKHKKKLLIVSQAQFGYHIDTYEYAKGLKDLYDITFFCWDYGDPKVDVKGVKVIYSSREGNIISRNLRFRREYMQLVAQDFDHCFIMYFVGASLAHRVQRQDRLICDIRTGETSPSILKRWLMDATMSLELSTFRNKSIISKSLAEKFRVKDYHLLPLGANSIPFKQKDFSDFHLVYVGEFDNRRMEDTVKGFGEFYQEYKDQINCRYTIIGAGRGNEREIIEEVVAEYGLEDVVKLTGYIQHDQLGSYLQAGNIGVSYIPITKYFDCQPPTKTFEYLLSGMAVIATATKENKLVIHEDNGVLIEDTAEAVTKGLIELYQRRFTYDAQQIQKESEERYSWNSIVRTNLHGYLSGGTEPKVAPQLEDA